MTIICYLQLPVDFLFLFAKKLAKMIKSDGKGRDGGRRTECHTHTVPRNTDKAGGTAQINTALHNKIESPATVHDLCANFSMF